MLKGKLLEQLHGLRGSLLCGVSGGADSMALLSLLVALRDAGSISLSACHVNHALRGEASDADEAFVREYCRAHGVPLHSFRLTPPESPGEEWARNARYDAFSQAMALSGADALVLAHHRDDQAETVLEHLLRGSGLDGLCGMRRESTRLNMRILRPLLDIPHDTLMQYLVQQGIAWRDDATNAQDDYFRNRVRHTLLPLMEELSHGASRHIANAAALLAEDADVLNQQAGTWLDFHPGSYLPAEELRSQPEGLQSRILRMWVRRETNGVMLDQERTRALLALLDAPAGSAETLPGGRRCCRGARFLHLPDETAKPLPEYHAEGMGTFLMGGVTVAIGRSRGNYGNGCTSQEMPAALLAGAQIRTRRPGDWIRPFGMDGRQSLQDYLVNRRVDEPFRDLVPLVCRGSEVLFVCGVGAGGIPRWSPETVNLRVDVTGVIPWKSQGARK